MVTTYAQAQVFITKQAGYAQTQTMVIGRDGLLAYMLSGSAYSQADNGTIVGTWSEGQTGKPNWSNSSVPFYFGNDNFGIRWQAWFVADATGSWTFASASDDGSGVFIYDETNTLVGSFSNNYGNGQGNTYRSGTISLTSGTRYKIDAKFGQGGGGWNIQIFYRRPGGTSDIYLTDGEPPWIPASPRSRVAQSQADIKQTYQGSAQALAQITVHYSLAQAQIDVKQTYKGFAQANAFISKQAGYAQVRTYVAGNAYEGIINSDTPYGYWRLDESSGTLAAARVGPDGTYKTSGITYGTSTPMPTDGVNKGVTVAGSGYMLTNTTQSTNTFSAEVWTRPSITINLPSESTNGVTGNATAGANSGGQNFIWYPEQQGNDRGIGLSVGTNGITVYAHGNGNLYALAVYTGTISSTMMTHIVVTMASKVPKIYLNGVLVRTGLTEGNTLAYAPIYLLGRDSYGSYLGTANNAALYNYTLTDTQVSTHYNAGIPRAFAQVQAQIDYGQPYSFAQAQVLVDTPFRFAQARSTIKATYTGTAQAQAFITVIANYILSRTLSFTPTSGNLLLQWIYSRDGHGFPLIDNVSGWTLLDQTNGSNFNDGIGVYGKISDGTESGYVWPNAYDGQSYVEVTGPIDLINRTTANNNMGFVTTWTSSSITPPSNRELILVGSSVNHGGTTSFSSSDRIIYSAGSSPTYAATWRPVDVSTGSYTMSITAANGEATRGIILAFVRNAAISDGFAQAQADIKATSTKFAQAQTTLALRSWVFGQSQAKIILINKAYAQAQAFIRTGVVNAQAQAYIVNTYPKFAQARTKVIYFGVNSAQGQAFIRRLISSNAQATTDILVTTNIFAQAGTTLALRVWPVAQSTAMVRGIGKPNAQANALIDRPYRFANVQALIRNGDKTQAQAQALIQRPKKAYAQAQTSIIAFNAAFAQAQVLLNQHLNLSQAQANIKQIYGTYAQAQAHILKPAAFAQAQAIMKGTITYQEAQAQTDIKQITQINANALALIKKPVRAYAQAQAAIKDTTNYYIGTAQAYIINGLKYGQAQAIIKLIPYVFAQTQVSITRTQGYAQASVDIKNTLGSYLVKYNGQYLPGYLQKESFDSDNTINAHNAVYIDGSISEYVGLRNKLISLEYKIVGNNFATMKQEVQKASTIFRSKKDGFARLFVNKTDRYYLAMARSFRSEADAHTTTHTLDYSLEYNVKPWEYSVETYTVSGSGSLSIPRTIDDGGWTPATILVTGTNVTVSGYTATNTFTGYFSVSGAVTNLVINSDAYTATINGVNKNNLMNNLDYAVYIGPGITYFTVNGATYITVSYNNRWY